MLCVFMLYSTIKLSPPAAPSQPTLTATPLYDSSGTLLEIDSRVTEVVRPFSYLIAGAYSSMQLLVGGRFSNMF